MIQTTTRIIIKTKTKPDSDIMKISFSNSDNPSMRYSLLTPGGYDESCSVVVITVIVVVGIISEGIIIVVVVVEVVVVEVVVLVVSGMKSGSIFIFSYFFLLT